MVKKTILIVDDSEFMRSILKTMLSADFTVVGEAGDGIKSIELYKELKPDIVTLDEAMDDMTGIEVLSQIMEFNPKAKIVMVSSVIDQAPYIKEAKELGAAAILSKPINRKELIDTLNRLF